MFPSLVIHILIKICHLVLPPSATDVRAKLHGTRLSALATLNLFLCSGVGTWTNPKPSNAVALQKNRRNKDGDPVPSSPPSSPALPGRLGSWVPGSDAGEGRVLVARPEAMSTVRVRLKASESPNVHIRVLRPSKTPPKFNEKTPKRGKRE